MIAITGAAALVACGDNPSPPPQINVSPPVSSPPQPVALSTPPAIPTLPSTGTAPNPAETVRDSATTNLKRAMSKEQESKSTPRAGQAGSHSSTVLNSKEASTK